MTLLGELVAIHRVTLVIVEHVFDIPRVPDLATTVRSIRDGGIAAGSDRKPHGR